MEKKIYEQSPVGKFFSYLFYYWIFVTALVFLPAFIYGIYFSGNSILQLLRNEQMAYAISLGEAWVFLLFLLLLSAGCIWYVWTCLKQMFLPSKEMIGFIVEKEGGKEKDGFFILLNNQMDKPFEVEEYVYQQLHEGQKIKLKYSLNPDYALEKT